MELSLLFWILMLLWLVLGAVDQRRRDDRTWFGIWAALLPFLMIAALGWQVFGAAVK